MDEKEEKVRNLEAEVKFGQDRQLAIKQKHAAEALLDHPAWSIIRDYLQAEIDRMTDEVVGTPLHISPEVTVERQEYVKGTIAGLKLALNLPASMSKIASDVLETLPPAEEDSYDDEDSYDTSD